MFEIQFEIKGTEVIRGTHCNNLSLAEFWWFPEYL